MSGAVPKSPERRTGGLIRTTAFDTARPWSAARETARTAYLGKRTFTTPVAWESSTFRQVDTCDTQRQWSSCARMTARNTQDLSDTKNKSNLAAINEALLAKVHETEKLVDLLRETLRSVDHELSALGAIPTRRITSYIRQTEQKIDINNKRMEVRQRRPKAENVEDDVQTELINVDGVLRHNLAQLLHCQKGIHTDMARLRDSKRELETDLRNKQAALEVDKRVLRDEAEDAANFGKSGSTGVGKMKSLTIYPAIWTNSTQSIVKNALARQGEAAKLRMAIDNVCQETVLQERSHRQHHQLAAMDKISKTKKLQNVLELERDNVATELQKAEGQDRAVCEQILDLEDSMEKVKRQHLYRSQRPDQEKVLDGVEMAMKRTLAEQRALHKNLLNSRPTLVGNIQAMRSNLNKLDKNVADKGHSIEADEEALLLDGRQTVSRPPTSASFRTEYSTSRPPTSSSRAAGSRNSSRASSLISRISELERELADARLKNDTIENSLAA
uniref:Uncharacterized protein n=2 Tax=Tetraselmis chuii TaxID=63592 RepID=A0A7S1X7P9_9CHLO|mmetsp:Transcript_36732/g.65756  ORF Transcript_36732/g.65756 Transcript_36732/m.65756 type:complete len:502 (+) Transcript_36732:169-1674(+)